MLSSAFEVSKAAAIMAAGFGVLTNHWVILSITSPAIQVPRLFVRPICSAQASHQRPLSLRCESAAKDLS
jgi:hypothetical protein